MFALNGKYKYKIIREIGRGGFGIVYLAKSGDKYFALKKIYNASASSHEINALRLYRDALGKKPIDGIIPIIDVISDDDSAYYTMPLGDGVDPKISPEVEDWKPLTLQRLIDIKRTDKVWFSKDEILKIILPLIVAIGRLSKLGLVHRDIKPANIVFFKGKPCIVDIGLVTPDRLSMSTVGTPDFSAPSWYIKSHGNPDMWGLALTLYFFATGNSPDMIGRSAFAFPPNGKSGLSKRDRTAWEHFYRVVLRATDEKQKDRYRNFSDFADDLKKIRSLPLFRRTYIKIIVSALLLAIAGLVSYKLYHLKPWRFGGEKAERKWVLDMTEKARALSFKENPTRNELALAFAIMALTEKTSKLAVKMPEFLETYIYICSIYSYFQRVIDSYQNYKLCVGNRKIPEFLWEYVLNAYSRLEKYTEAEKVLSEMLAYSEKQNPLSKYKRPSLRFVARATIIKDPLMSDTVYQDFMEMINFFSNEQQLGVKILSKKKEDMSKEEIMFLKNLKSDSAAMSLLMDRIPTDAPEFYQWLAQHQPKVKKFIDDWQTYTKTDKK